MTKQTDLIAYVFDAQAHLLSAQLLQWMDASARFTLFVETYRDKIRKKIRVLRDAESALDLLGELEVAAGLLADRRFTLVYEPYASARRRGADFAVTYRANLVFNIEVARIRAEESARVEARIVRILLDKLGQMQPGMANLLSIHTRADRARAIDLGRLMQTVKTRVEAQDPAIFSASRYAGPPDFYKDFLRLSGILLWGGGEEPGGEEPGGEEPGGGKPWINKQARPALDEKVIRLVQALSSPNG